MKVTKKLAKCISDRMDELNLSYKDVESNSRGTISNGSVWNIVNERVKDVKEETFNNLAKGLKMTPAELLERLESDTKQEFKHSEIEVLLHEADSLTKKDLEEMQPIWNMVKAEIRRRKAEGSI